MKTAKEILEELTNKSFYEGLKIDPNEEYASDGWEPNVEDALRQLREAIEREVIGEDYKLPADLPPHSAMAYPLEEYAKSRLRHEQRAKLRAFCGMGDGDKD